MSILKLEPVFKQVIWGGSRMRYEFGYNIPGDDTGECWAVSAHPNGDCVISEGEYKGKTLSQLWENNRELFGGVENPVFPLLTKIIDAKDDLSIQVHPDDSYAKLNENGSLGKTECWYILDCKDDATIIMGHNAKSREELVDMIEGKRWNEFLREVPIKKGDFLQIYPGTVHAIKGGTMILETQQNSDITYRVYDYDRLSNGKLRPLHIEKSIAVIKVPFEGSEAKEKCDPLKVSAVQGKCECEPLIKCDYYKVWKLDTDGRASFETKEPFLICSVIGGEGTITDSDGYEGTVKKGDHFILTSGTTEFCVSGEISMICSTV